MAEETTTAADITEAVYDLLGAVMHDLTIELIASVRIEIIWPAGEDSGVDVNVMIVPKSDEDAPRPIVAVIGTVGELEHSDADVTVGGAPPEVEGS